MEFSQQWVDIIMLCVTSGSYYVVVNDQLVGPIKPKRGLRQGDPLSPYLFILCAEGLSTLIEEAARKGVIHGSQVCRGALSISHLLFADDSVMFFRANIRECQAVKEILHNYEMASGQAVNFGKSGVMFSRNVEPTDQGNLSSLLEVLQPLNTGKYLGVPSLIGRSKKAVFRYIRDRVWRKVNDWRGKGLSKAGREVLVKSVGHAIPSYCMSSFLIPFFILEELQRMLNSFWWGSSYKRGLNLMGWDKMCVRKEFGGLGFRDLRCFNLALLAKHGWNFITNPNALVSQVFRAKYFSDGNLVNANLGHNPSFTWRGIWHALILLKQGLRWKIGDGRRVKYMVKSGYRVGRRLLALEPSSSEYNWQKIWSLTIPPKIKSFLWRATRDTLPTKIKLRTRVKLIGIVTECANLAESFVEWMFMMMSKLNEVDMGIQIVKEAEAISLLEALSWIRQLDLNMVHLEMDAKTVVDAVNKENPNISEFGSIVEQCRLLLNGQSGFSLKWVSRHSNIVAHSLAK
ncbi:uncharacterized protein [Henckelia pumila]|uniref:uncharacterized protein n=1 Tax=Henckelia pumila TaxID=405737 RepID=UPI003C6E505E